METGRSKEDYLETILVIERQKGEVRSVDVAEHLGFSKASVSRAISVLSEEHLVLFGPDKRIRLTPAGRVIAEQVYEKHCFFRSMLEQAGIQPSVAAREACLIEHVISDESFGKLKKDYEENRHVQAVRKTVASGE